MDLDLGSNADDIFKDRQVGGIISAESVVQGSLFRSPFDPRSDDDLVSSIYGGSEDDSTIRKRRPLRKPVDVNGAVDQSIVRMRLEEIGVAGGSSKRARNRSQKQGGRHRTSYYYNYFYPSSYSSSSYFRLNTFPMTSV